MSWDTSYGSGGLVRVGSPYDPRGTLAYQGGKLAILGSGGLIYQSSSFAWVSDMTLRRLDVNGAPVGPALSWPGIVNVPGLPMLRRPDGRLLVGAMRSNVPRDGGSFWDAALIQLDRNGNADPSFGDGGVASIPLSKNQARGGGDMVAAIAVDSVGRIYLAIASYGYVNVEPDIVTIVRLDAQGRLDLKYPLTIDPAGDNANGFNTRLTVLAGNELRLDLSAKAYYFGADGTSIAAPTRLNSLLGGYSPCLCDNSSGWSLVGSLATGELLYAGIPNGQGLPGITLDTVRTDGAPGAYRYGVEYSNSGEALYPHLARVSQTGSHIYVVAQTPLGTAIVRLPVPGNYNIFDPPNSVFVLPSVSSRLQILDIGEQPDGSLIVTTQASGASTTDTGFAAFRIPAGALPAAGTVTVQTPGLLLNSSTTSSPPATSSPPTASPAATSSAPVSAGTTGGGGAADSLFLTLLSMVLALGVRRQQLASRLLALLVVVSSGGPLHAAVGDWDNSFGDEGIVRRLSSGGSINAPFALLGNGGLIYDPGNPAGVHPFQLMRTDINGRGPDNALDWPGIGALSAPAGLSATRSLRQSDGRLLLANARLSSKQPAVLRLDRDGSLDPTFGSGGVVEPGIGYIDAVALQADQRILVGIGQYNNDIFSGESILRLNPDGSRDGNWSVEVGTLGGYADWDEGLSGITPLYGGELRLDFYVRGTMYVGADGLARSAPNEPTRWGFEAGTCGEYRGLTVAGSLADGDQLLVGIPTSTALPGFTMARVRNDGTLNRSFGGDSGAPPGFFCYRVPGAAQGATTATRDARPSLLARLGGNGRYTYVVIPATASAVGTRILRVVNDGPGAGQLDPAFHGGYMDLPWPGSALQIGDLAEQPDGNIVVSLVDCNV